MYKYEIQFENREAAAATVKELAIKIAGDMGYGPAATSGVSGPYAARTQARDLLLLAALDCGQFDEKEAIDTLRKLIRVHPDNMEHAYDLAYHAREQVDALLDQIRAYLPE